MSVLYEKGSAAWDVSIILTRHGDGRVRTQNGDYLACARLSEVRRTATWLDSQERLRLALAVPCTCGAGDSIAESTSLGQAKLAETGGADVPARDGLGADESAPIPSAA
jgi:hypothetical protein